MSICILMLSVVFNFFLVKDELVNLFYVWIGLWI